MNLSLKSVPFVLALAAASHGQAAVVFSNFGPGDSFNAVAGNLVLGENEITIGNIDQAMPFMVGGVDVSFTSAELALRHTGGPNSLRVMVMSDAGGLPGATLMSIPVAGVPGVPGIVEAVGLAALTLNANTQYWIAADATSNTELVWHRNSIGQFGRAGRAGWPVGPWNFNGNQESLAFRVNGRFVPAPATLAMLGLGGLVAGRRRRL